MKMKTFILVIVAFIELLFFGLANAQSSYPNRTIQTIMPLQAGSGVDILMRPIAQKMAESLGQAITIENIPGGAGLIGATKVAQSPADDGRRCARRGAERHPPGAGRGRIRAADGRRPRCARHPVADPRRTRVRRAARRLGGHGRGVGDRAAGR